MLKLHPNAKGVIGIENEQARSYQASMQRACVRAIANIDCCGASGMKISLRAAEKQLIYCYHKERSTFNYSGVTARMPLAVS